MIVAPAAASSDRSSGLRGGSGFPTAAPNQSVVQSVIGQVWPRTALKE